MVKPVKVVLLGFIKIEQEDHRIHSVHELPLSLLWYHKVMEKQSLNHIRDSKNHEEAQKDVLSNGVKKTYRYRLYPNKNQQEILEKQLSLCRWLYNHFLEERKTLYKKQKMKFFCYDQIKKIPKLKKEKTELREVYSQTLQDIARRLDKAFQNFFRRVKENKNGKRQKRGYPRFKGYWRYDSFVFSSIRI